MWRAPRKPWENIFIPKMFTHLHRTHEDPSLTPQGPVPLLDPSAIISSLFSMLIQEEEKFYSKKTLTPLITEQSFFQLNGVQKPFPQQPIQLVIIILLLILFIQQPELFPQRSSILEQHGKYGFIVNSVLDHQLLWHVVKCRDSHHLEKTC
jgi:hypothetical protein